MARIAVRHVATTRGPSLPGTILLGLGIGVVAGFLAGELLGPAASRAINPVFPVTTRPSRGTGPVARLVANAQAVLDDDVVLRECHLEVLAVGPGRIELHGWVPDRRSRARAGQLVSDAVAADAIINRLQVHGEDDLATPAEIATDEQTA
jgi:hypothetical protein